jgi:hypothetical protein
MSSTSKILELLKVNFDEGNVREKNDNNNQEMSALATNDYSAVSRMSIEELRDWLAKKGFENEILNVLADYMCDGIMFIALTDLSIDEMFPATSRKQEERDRELRGRRMLRMRRDAVLATKPTASGNRLC